MIRLPILVTDTGISWEYRARKRPPVIAGGYQPALYPAEEQLRDPFMGRPQAGFFTAGT